MKFNWCVWGKGEPVHRGPFSRLSSHHFPPSLTLGSGWAGEDTRIVKENNSCDIEDQSQVAIIGDMDHLIVRVKSSGRDVCR